MNAAQLAGWRVVTGTGTATYWYLVLVCQG